MLKKVNKHYKRLVRKFSKTLWQQSWKINKTLWQLQRVLLKKQKLFWRIGDAIVDVWTRVLIIYNCLLQQGAHTVDVQVQLRLERCMVISTITININSKPRPTIFMVITLTTAITVTTAILPITLWPMFHIITTHTIITVHQFMFLTTMCMSILNHIPTTRIHIMWFAMIKKTLQLVSMVVMAIKDRCNMVHFHLVIPISQHNIMLHSINHIPIKVIWMHLPLAIFWVLLVIFLSFVQELDQAWVVIQLLMELKHCIDIRTIQVFKFMITIFLMGQSIVLMDKLNILHSIFMLMVQHKILVLKQNKCISLLSLRMVLHKIQALKQNISNTLHIMVNQKQVLLTTLWIHMIYYLLIVFKVLLLKTLLTQIAISLNFVQVSDQAWVEQVLLMPNRILILLKKTPIWILLFVISQNSAQVLVLVWEELLLAPNLNPFQTVFFQNSVSSVPHP